VYIETIRFSHILEPDTLENINYFSPRTAFVISHKSESVETLQGVLWYLPTNSPIIIVSNCLQEDIEHLKTSLRAHLSGHKKIYFIHQKDDNIAQFFRITGVHHLLGKDGKVLDGKGEGMYIGSLFAALLHYPQWVIFYDADNLVPSALLEYTLAMCRLFTSNASYVPASQESNMADLLHNARICWSSKPEVNNGSLDYKLLGRCTSVVSPLLTTLLEEWFGIQDYPINSSNAGEQGMNIKTVKALRFSSGYSIETFQFLELLSKSFGLQGQPHRATLQQYQAKSPHFHTKRGDEHIRKMIAESLGCFFVFRDSLPALTANHLQRICDEMSIDLSYPLIYPALEDLHMEDVAFLPLAIHSEGDGADATIFTYVHKEAFLHQYKLFNDIDSQDTWTVTYPVVEY
jgi:mannosyl-3-phosphoglycerate synthase